MVSYEFNKQEIFSRKVFILNLIFFLLLILQCYDNGICMSVNCIYFLITFLIACSPGRPIMQSFWGKMNEKWKENYQGYFRKIQFSICIIFQFNALHSWIFTTRKLLYFSKINFYVDILTWSWGPVLSLATRSDLVAASVTLHH